MNYNKLIISNYKDYFHKSIQQKEEMRRINFNFYQIYTCIRK